MLIINTMSKLFVAIIIGYVMNKRGVLTKDVNSKISSLIIQVACPCLIISSVTSMSSDNKGLALYLLAIGVVIYLVVPIISYLLVRLLPLNKESRRTYQCMLMFSNCGFMALPVIQSIFGDQAIFYSSLIHMPYNLLFFTLGAYLLAKDGEGEFQFEIKQLISVGVISSVVAIVLYFTSIPLPEMISGSLSFIGTLVTPLSMISIGASIADYPIIEVLKEKSLYLITLLRLAIVPAVLYFVISIFVKDTMIVQIATITIGMPVGSMVAMGASVYHGNVKLASSSVALSTMLSMISIPIMLFLLGIG